MLVSSFSKLLDTIRLELSISPLSLALKPQGERVDNEQNIVPVLFHFAVDGTNGPRADAIVLADRPSAQITPTPPPRPRRSCAMPPFLQCRRVDAVIPRHRAILVQHVGAGKFLSLLRIQVAGVAAPGVGLQSMTKRVRKIDASWAGHGARATSPTAKSKGRLSAKVDDSSKNWARGRTEKEKEESLIELFDFLFCRTKDSSGRR